MRKLSIGSLLCFLLLALAGPAPSGTVAALPLESSSGQGSQPTPAELINAVNALRLSNGLPALQVNAILTQTAQGQANALLATDGAVGHARPGGMSYTEQLLLLGYPLAGDLTLGGYRAENFVFGNGLTVQDAVQLWLGDTPHTSTMLSPNYLDIGAGVAQDSDGTIYYVIDCARPTASGQPQSDAASMLLTATVVSQLAGMSQYIVPVSMSTARPDGIVYHKVQYGQTLWSVAIEYHTTIKNLQALNNLSDTAVYEGQILLVQRGATQPAPSAPAPEISPSLTPTPFATLTAEGSPSPATVTVFPGTTDIPPVDSSNGFSPGLWVAVVMLVLLIGATAAVFFIRPRS